MTVFDLTLWWGKAVGAMLGWMLGDASGCLLGLLLGHVFDQRLRLQPLIALLPGGSHRQAAVLALAGRVWALGNGKASADAVLDDLLAELGIAPQRRALAARAFACGAMPGAPLNALLDWFRYGSMAQPETDGEELLALLGRVAAADTEPALAQLQFLARLAARLSVDLGAAYRWRAGGTGEPETELADRGGLDLTLEEACRILGVDSLASVAEIKQAYRRAVARHHPDRLQAQGASEAQLREAAERTHEIRCAYNDIRSSRGF